MSSADVPVGDADQPNTAAPRGRALRNFGLLLTSEVAGQLIAFFLGAYLARALGVHGFGAWVWATAIIGYLVLSVDGGTETWGMREVSAHPERLRGSVVNVLALRGVFVALALVLLTLIAATAYPERRWALVCGGTSLAALALQSGWAHRGLEHASPAFASLLQRLCMLAAVLALVRAPAHAFEMTLIQGLTEIAAAVLLLALLAPRLRTGERVSLRRMRDIARTAWPFGGARALRGLPFVLNAVILGYFWHDADVAHFGAAQRVAMLLLVLGTVFGTATFPAMARASVTGGETERRVIGATFRLLATVLTPLVVGGVLVATPLVALLFGPAYADAAAPLRVLFTAFFLTGVSDNLRRVLHARHHQRQDLRLVITATAGGLAATAVLTPWLGAMGAAYATLAGELLLIVMVVRALAASGPAPPLAAALAFPALAAAAMAAVVLLVRSYGLVASVGAGALVYLGVLWLARARLLDDLRQLELRPPTTPRPDAA